MPLRFGTLVVFTDGTDRAHRASIEDVTRDARRRRQHVRDLRHRRRPGGRQRAAVAHRPIGDVRVAEQGRRAARVRRDLGAHRVGVEEVLPALVLLAEPRGRTRGRGRGERRREQRPARLPVQRHRLRAELRSQPEAGVRHGHTRGRRRRRRPGTRRRRCSGPPPQSGPPAKGGATWAPKR